MENIKSIEAIHYLLNFEIDIVKYRQIRFFDQVLKKI